MSFEFNRGHEFLMGKEGNRLFDQAIYVNVGGCAGRWPRKIQEFTDDGVVMLTTSLDSFHWWETSTGRLLYQYEMPTEMMYHAKSRGTLAAVMHLATRRSLELRDLQRGEPVGEINAGGPILIYYFDAAGESLYVLAANELTQWDLSTYEQVKAHPLPFVPSGGGLPSPDLGRVVGISGDSVLLADVAAGTLVGGVGEFYDRGWEVAISPDHRFLALSRGLHWTNDVRLETWDAAGLQRLHVIGPGRFANTINDLQFTPDGESVVSSQHEDRLLAFWDPESGEKVDEFESEESISSFAFSRDGSVLATGGE